MKVLKYLLAIVLLVGGFFLGTAWKTTQDTNQEQDLTETSNLKESEEEASSQALNSHSEPAAGFKLTSDEQSVIKLSM